MGSQVVVFTYPMVHHCDMEERMAQEVMDVCVNACEKHWVNWSNSQMVCHYFNRKLYLDIYNLQYLQCAKLIKEALDSRYEAANMPGI